MSGVVRRTCRKRAALRVELVVEQGHCFMQIARLQVCVPSGHGEGLMPQHFLNVVQGRSARNHVWSECVAQAMEANLFNSRLRLQNVKALMMRLRGSLQASFWEPT